MKRLTAKEEEVMGRFWEKGPLFVRELLSFYDDPKPHFNTLSTVVRGLEEKGFVSHRAYGNTYQYFATVSRDDYRRGSSASISTIPTWAWSPHWCRKRRFRWKN